MTATQPREIVAQMFFAGSLFIGIPSALLFVYIGWGWLELHLLKPPDTSASPHTGNLIIDGLATGAALFGKSLSLMNIAAEWVMGLVAAAAFILSMLAAVLFAVSRGLHAGRTWARMLGILMASAPFLISLVMLASFRRPAPMALGTAGMLLAGYAIWALGWRFV